MRLAAEAIQDTERMTQLRRQRLDNIANIDLDNGTGNANRLRDPLRESLDVRDKLVWDAA